MKLIPAGVKLLVAGVLLAACSSCTRPRLPAVLSFAGSTMGTTYSVKFVSTATDRVADQLQLEVEQLLETINQQMSTYLDDSEISRFNRSTETDWFPVSAELAEVVSAAQGLAEQTRGRLDITVGPLVDLWSFGSAPRTQKAPSEAEIEAARARVGYHYIEVRREPPALRKSRADVAIDLSAIAKGFAVDRVAELLDSNSVSHYLVEIGGEVRARGRKPDGTTWRVGIERPVVDAREIQLVLALTDRALASSGDYRNFFEWEGERYSHEIDPRTGFPVRDPLAAASVLADDAMTADALATALLVMGAEQARQFAESRQLDVLLISREGDGFRQWMTPGFARCVARQAYRTE